MQLDRSNSVSAVTARTAHIPFSLLQIVVALDFICYYNKSMRITFDAVKRETTLLRRGLDFARAREVFGGVSVTTRDTRFDYGEAREITVGYLDGEVIVLVWTQRGSARRIISMRRANEREIAKYANDLG